MAIQKSIPINISILTNPFPWAPKIAGPLCTPGPTAPPLVGPLVTGYESALNSDVCRIFFLTRSEKQSIINVIGLKIITII